MHSSLLEVGPGRRLGEMVAQPVGAVAPGQKVASICKVALDLRLHEHIDAGPSRAVRRMASVVGICRTACAPTCSSMLVYVARLPPSTRQAAWAAACLVGVVLR